MYSEWTSKRNRAFSAPTDAAARAVDQGSGPSADDELPSNISSCFSSPETGQCDTYLALGDVPGIREAVEHSSIGVATSNLKSSGTRVQNTVGVVIYP